MPDAEATLNRRQLVPKGLTATITGVAPFYLVGPAFVIAGLPVPSA